MSALLLKYYDGAHPNITTCKIVSYHIINICDFFEDYKTFSLVKMRFELGIFERYFNVISTYNGPFYLRNTEGELIYGQKNLNLTFVNTLRSIERNMKINKAKKYLYTNEKILLMLNIIYNISNQLHPSLNEGLQKIISSLKTNTVDISIF